ncbi:MAG: type II toxin-antitoxin system Phd/YefM family antitoxin [Treponema sp.]|nr:type II toxin-antitoxin system Phd/YefM family antitoxin [Treponema sp.]
MKFVTVRDFRTSPANIWKALPKEQEMVITNNGKPIALLTPLSDRNLEETLSAIRRAKAINAVKMIQQESIKNGTDKITMEEINSLIKKSRQERRQSKGSQQKK